MKDIEKISALALMGAGVLLTVAGFIVPPLGEISDSVLWMLAQTLIYAGAVFGVKIYIDDLFLRKLEHREEEYREEMKREVRKK